MNTLVLIIGIGCAAAADDLYAPVYSSDLGSNVDAPALEDIHVYIDENSDINDDNVCVDESSLDGVKDYNLTGVKDYNLTGVKDYNLTADNDCNFISADDYYLAGVKDYNLTVVKHSDSLPLPPSGFNLTKVSQSNSNNVVLSEDLLRLLQELYGDGQLIPVNTPDDNGYNFSPFNPNDFDNIYDLILYLEQMRRLGQLIPSYT